MPQPQLKLDYVVMTVSCGSCQQEQLVHVQVGTEVNDSGDDRKNRISWRAKLACELGTKKAKKYLQAFPRPKKKFVAFLGFASGFLKKAAQFFLMSDIRLGSYRCLLKRERRFLSLHHAPPSPANLRD